MAAAEVLGALTSQKEPFSHSDMSTILRKAVRRTDSLLFATEGRIGGLGAEPRFRSRNLAVPLRRGWSREAVVRVMYRVAIC